MFLETEEGLQSTVKELVKEALSIEMLQFQEAAVAGTSKQTQTKSKLPESIFIHNSDTTGLESSR